MFVFFAAFFVCAIARAAALAAAAPHSRVDWIEVLRVERIDWRSGVVRMTGLRKERTYVPDRLRPRNVSVYCTVRRTGEC